MSGHIIKGLLKFSTITCKVLISSNSICEKKRFTEFHKL